MKNLKTTPKNEFKVGDTVAVQNTITGKVSYVGTILTLHGKAGNIAGANISIEGKLGYVENTLNSALKIS